MNGVSSVTTADWVRQDKTSPQSSIDQISRGDFLNLLVTQLKNQDPMNPIQDGEFAAQIIQYNMLEELLQLKSVVSGMANNILYLATLGQVSKLIGKEVRVIEDDGEQSAAGMVEKVMINQGVPKLVINGKEYGVDQIVEILDGQGGEET
jgi:flagellar basal-body rod modification protein FlgD